MLFGTCEEGLSAAISRLRGESYILIFFLYFLKAEDVEERFLSVGFEVERSERGQGKGPI